MKNLKSDYYDTSKFRLLSIGITEGERSYDFTIYNKEISSGCGITLIVGRNGVGKSYLLRAIIEFFIGFENYRHNKKI